MSGNTFFSHLGTLTRHPCFQTKVAHAEAMQTTLCPGCAHPRPGVTTVDVWLQEERSPRNNPLNFLYGCGMGLIHQGMLELLGSVDIDRDLYLGRVYNKHDRECADWRTFHGRRKVIMRGSKDAHYRTCDECGRNIYYATGKPYLFPAPPPDAVIYGSDLGGLVVSADVMARINTKKWRSVAIEELPVLEVPTDGLGLLPYRQLIDPKSSAV